MKKLRDEALVNKIHKFLRMKKTFNAYEIAGKLGMTDTPKDQRRFSIALGIARRRAKSSGAFFRARTKNEPAGTYSPLSGQEGIKVGLSQITRSLRRMRNQLEQALEATQHLPKLARTKEDKEAIRRKQARVEALRIQPGGADK